MQIDVTELEPCKLSIHYEANAFEIMDKRAEIQNLFKKAPVPGFRPGKATLEAIKIHYRQQIEESLKRALAEDAYHNTLFEKKFRPHGAPRFNSLLLDGGKFVCEFEMLTKPDFELPQWQNLEIPKPHAARTAEEIAEMLMQELRVRLGDAVPYSESDFVQNGDNIIIDYEGSVDGEPLESLTAQGEMITVGKGQLQGFDSNLLGMIVGETREFDFVAPQESLPSLAGKLVHFKVTLNTGAKTVPCPLDDELAKKMGKNTLEEVKEIISQNAFARAANAAKMSVHEAVAKRLVNDAGIAVPNWMTLSEAQYLAQQSQVDWNVLPDADKQKFMDMSEQNVKLSLILDKIRESEPEAQLTDQEVFEIIKNNLANSKIQGSLDEVMQQMSRTGYLQILFSRIRDEHTMDFITKSVSVIE